MTSTVTLATIEVEHLTKSYGNLKAIDDLSFSVGPGRIFGFIGPNGAGKSTTIGCLTGLLDPDAGSIWLLGEPFTSEAVDLKRRIGVLPEGLALFDYLYPHEFLNFQARMFGVDEEAAISRVTELLEAMDLNSERGKRLGELSTGMRKRVAFGAAIVHNPEILFLDEPFESVDAAAVANLKEFLRKFADQEGTVFLTTHVLETVERLCGEVAIIRAGKLLWRGDLMALSHGGAIEFEGNSFRSLESLYLKLVGERQVQFSWMSQRL